MKIKLDKTDSRIVVSNETYNVIDNTNLNNLIVSKTELHPGKETGGHNHSGQEEVYIFLTGNGYIYLNEKKMSVQAGATVLIEDGVFHRVESGASGLYFV